MKIESYHIIFPKGYYSKSIGFRSVEHETWNLKPEENLKFKFGGKFSNDLNRLFEVDVELEVNNCKIGHNTFVLNFNNFFNAQLEGKNLYYKHESNKEITPIHHNINSEINYSNYPLKETEIRLAITPSKYISQKWIGNSNRIGSRPIWVQKEEYPECPICNQKMKYIFQLDSDLPDLNEKGGNEIMFGNDGICYAYWCDIDKISSYLWQCT